MSVSNKLLIIGFVWPEPTSSAAGGRMMQLIRYFNDQDWQITFASSANSTDHMEDLVKHGLNTVFIKINDQNFDQFVKDLNPHIVLFDRFMTEEQFGWRVHANVPDAIRVLDLEDLHCLRYAREDALKAGDTFTEDYLFTDLAKREIASIYRSDLSLVISEYELHLLNNIFRIDSDLLFYLPYLLEPISDTRKSLWPSYSDRSHFISIGNFRHKPNLDAVHYLKQELWPIIRKSLPDAEVHIYGSYPSPKVEKLHDPSVGFIIKGRANDAKTVLKNARVSLAPLRFGAGLKGKLTDSMQCGTPSITTTIGAEGINGELEWPGEITDDPNKFAEAAVRFYNEETIWKEAQHRGEIIINDRFSASDFNPVLSQRLILIREQLEVHRRQNFTGAMLMHHTMASTRFMSRWIEEKNQEKG